MPNVDATAKQIDGLLHDDGFLGLSRNDHLHKISALLQQLHGNQLNQAFDKLGSDDLKMLAGKIDSGGVFGAQGLSSGERQDLFNDLARNADGQHLASLSGDLGRDDTQALAQSVGNFGTTQTKLDYIKGLGPQTTRQDDAVNAGFGETTLTTGSPAANAVGTVLGSMRGTALDNALGSLTDSQLQSVMKASEHETVTTTSIGQGATTETTTYDTKQLANIINATASTTDVQQKARVFQYGAQALNDINGSNTLLSPDVTADSQLKQVSGALTNLLGSNTTGVVDQFNTNDATGQALISYTRQMVNEGQSGQQQLGRFIAQLRQGNDLRTDPTTYLNTYEGDHFYRNAENLGYFTGAIEEGLLQNTQDTNAGADVIRNVFNAASSAARTFGPTPVKVAIPLANGLTQAGINSVVNGINGKVAGERTAFYELALGQDAHGNRYRGPAEPFFTTGIVNVAGPAAEVP